MRTGVQADEMFTVLMGDQVEPRKDLSSNMPWKQGILIFKWIASLGFQKKRKFCH